MEKITFCPEDGEAVEFFVLEQTRLGGVDYILVTDSEDDDAEALILKEPMHFTWVRELKKTT